MGSPFFAVYNPPEWVQEMARDMMAAEAANCIAVRNRRMHAGGPAQSCERAGRLPIVAKTLAEETRFPILALLKEQGPLPRASIARILGVKGGELDYPITHGLTHRLIAKVDRDHRIAIYRLTKLGQDVLSRAEAQKRAAQAQAEAPLPTVGKDVEGHPEATPAARKRISVSVSHFVPGSDVRISGKITLSGGVG